MRIIRTCSFLLLLAVLSLYAGEKQDSLASGYDIVVAQDGTGNFKTVQEALNAVPDHSEKRTVIFIKPGRYRERLILPASKPNVTLIGADTAGVILTYDNHVGMVFEGDSVKTETSYSFNIRADGFTAERVTFENSAGRVGQAVAVMTDGDKTYFHGCRFIGNQDVLFTRGMGRCYVKDCYIEGTTDFIFGSSIAVFDHCLIRSKKKSHVTAASTPQGNAFGFVFLNCILISDSGLNGVSLGRPWRPYARVVYLHCNIGPHIGPAGWHNWKNPENEKTAYYAEYQCTGPGADTSGRVPWSKRLSDDEAARYTVPIIFAKGSAVTPFADDWNPQAGE